MSDPSDIQPAPHDRTPPPEPGSVPVAPGVPIAVAGGALVLAGVPHKEFVRHYLAHVFQGATGFELRSTLPFVKPTPVALLWAAPQAFGGAVPNRWHGLSDSAGPLVTLGLPFSAEIREEWWRAQILHGQQEHNIAFREYLAHLAERDTQLLLRDVAVARANRGFVPTEFGQLHGAGTSAERELALRGFRVVPGGALGAHLEPIRADELRALLPMHLVAPQLGPRPQPLPSGFVEWPADGTGLVDDLQRTNPPDP